MTSLHHRRPWQLLLLAVLFVVLLDPSNGELLPQPSVRWTHRLTGSGGLSGRGLRKDNAVVVHKGGNLIFVTADDGSLHIINTQSMENDNDDDDNNSIVFEPDTVPGTSTSCRSGVSQVEDDGGRTQYLVYAVIDTPVVSGVGIARDGTLLPASNGIVQANSRLLAVDLDGQLQWTLPIQGIIAGTPLIGENDSISIYVSHNVPNETDDPFDSRGGYLSVVLLKEDEEGNTTPEITASYSRGAPFGPLSLTTITEEGDKQIVGRTIDIVAVAENWDYGYRQDGSVYLLLPSDSYEPLQGQGEQSYNLRLASSWPYSAVSRPTLSANGESLWMNGYGSTVSGWTENRDLADVITGRNEDIFPRWSANFQTTERNVTQAILSAAVVSSDESLLYFGGASYDLFCVEASSGREVWTDFAGRSVRLMEPKLSEVDGSAVVYSIELLKGTVRQHDASSGDRNWEFSCSDLTGVAACQDAVEAEFSLAPSRNILYYGDIYGKIAAIEVATYATAAPTGHPTGMPSIAPTIGPTTTLQPSGVPNSFPTASPINEGVGLGVGDVKTAEPTFAPVASGLDSAKGAGAVSGKDDDSSTLLLGLIGAATVVMLALAVALILRSRRDQGQKKEMFIVEEAPLDLEDGSAERDDDSLASSDPSVSVEVIGGSAVYSAKTKRTRKKRTPPTPPTPLTLTSIEEDHVIEEEEEDHEQEHEHEELADEAPSPSRTTVLLFGDETYQRQDYDSNEEMMRNRTAPVSNRSGMTPARNLDQAFSYVIEVQTEEGEDELTGIMSTRARERAELQNEGAVSRVAELVVDGGEEKSTSRSKVEKDRVITPVPSFEQTSHEYHENGHQQNDSSRSASPVDRMVTPVPSFEHNVSPIDDISQASEVEAEHGLVGTANGGTHLELSVGNNANFRPLSPASPIYDLNTSSSHSRMSVATSESDAVGASTNKSIEDEDQDYKSVTVPREEEKKEDENIMAEPKSPMSSAYNSDMSQHLSPGACSTDASLYLDDDNDESQGTRSPLPPLTPTSVGRSPHGSQVSDDKKHNEFLNLLAQPGLVHNDSNDTSKEDSLMAPGSHYIMDRVFNDKSSNSRKGRASIQTSSPRSSPSPPPPQRGQSLSGNGKYGQSVRPKSGKFAARFRSLRPKGPASNYLEFDGSDSDSSQEASRDHFSKPSFRTVSRKSKQEEKEIKKDDSWSEFLHELEEAEEQFFSPSRVRPGILGGETDHDDDDSLAPPPPPQEQLK